MKRQIPLGRLSLEFMVIVIGVLVALGVDQWMESLDNRRLVTETLRALAAEIAENTRTLEGRIEYHDSILPGLVTLQRAAERGQRVTISIRETLPKGLGITSLRNTAWEMAGVTEAVRHFDLPLLSILSLTYSIQDALHERDRAVADGIIQPEYFVASDQVGPVIFLSVTVSDVRDREVDLQKFYVAALEAVRERLDDPEAGAVIEIS